MLDRNAFMDSLMRTVPELAPVLRQHLEEENGELLPHVFFGDVTRFVESAATQLSTKDALARLLRIIETGLREGDNYVRELLAVSFAENLAWEKDIQAALKGMMGPLLRKEIELFESGRWPDER